MVDVHFCVGGEGYTFWTSSLSGASHSWSRAIRKTKYEQELTSVLEHYNSPNRSCSLVVMSTKLVSALEMPRRNAPANEAPPVGPVDVASMSTLLRHEVS